MDENNPPLFSLTLYKKRPARVVQVAPRLEIELEDGNRAKVRPKDINLLHPGPLTSLKDLTPQEGEVELAWQILAEVPDRKISLAALADLIYGAFTPAAAWAAWSLVEDGLFFTGIPEAIVARSPQAVEKEQTNRRRQEAEAQAWQAFLNRLTNDQTLLDQDAGFMRDVEDLAYGRQSGSRVLRALGRTERPENAHDLLLSTGFWKSSHNPYPARHDISTEPPQLYVPTIDDELRLDLTHLDAFAIDDIANQDPDDAISLENFSADASGCFQAGQVWVHIADVACLVPPDCPMDIEARNRGATLYLPEKTVTMLPELAIQKLGLGFQEKSPALSFLIEINTTGEIVCKGIHPSWVKITRLSYQMVETKLDQQPFQQLHQIGAIYRNRRNQNGAFSIDLPEINIRLMDGQIVIQPLEILQSRSLVREAMLMAGEAAAQFAIHNGIPFPFTAQESFDKATDQFGKKLPFEIAQDLAEFFALRSRLKKSQVSSHPAPHAGLGLPIYSRATSPLRRYLDLVAHQQLRAYLVGKPVLNEQEMLNRVGVSMASSSAINTVESLSRRHWTLVYLQQNPGWHGEAVLVEKVGLRGRVIIPELALESLIHLTEDMPLNTRFQVGVRQVNLAELEVALKILDANFNVDQC